MILLENDKLIRNIKLPKENIIIALSKVRGQAVFRGMAQIPHALMGRWNWKF